MNESDVILVTGGAGFIGSHACKALAAAGFRPVVFDNLSMGHRHAVKWGPLVVGDVGDAEALRRVFGDYSIAGVLHFAASAYVGESVGVPLRYYRNNVATTMTLLEVMVEAGVPPLVFSSSCATYGTPTEVPIPVSHEQRPINPYGWTKLMGEQMIRDAGHAHGLRSVILRYFNAAGADPDGDLCEEHDPETHLIPLVLQAASGRRPNIGVFGRDYDTPDGTCVRDYIHIEDLCSAHWLALQSLMGGAGSQAYNLGNGQGFSVQEVIDTAQQVTGRSIAVVNGPRRAGDPARLVADSSLIREKLGWQPRYADLATIVAHAWAWETRQT